MPARVQVHAAIWVGEKLVVYRHARGGRERVSLPGGRVKDRESLTAALEREAQEEIDRDIGVGDLLFAAEVVSAASRQEVVLIFLAHLRTPADADGLDLIDPTGPEANIVLPPVLGHLARCRDGIPNAQAPRWLGNLHDSNLV